jgi:hypothetical protein
LIRTKEENQRTGEYFVCVLSIQILKNHISSVFFCFFLLKKYLLHFSHRLMANTLLEGDQIPRLIEGMRNTFIHSNSSIYIKSKGNFYIL